MSHNSGIDRKEAKNNKLLSKFLINFYQCMYIILLKEVIRKQGDYSNETHCVRLAHANLH